MTDTTEQPWPADLAELIEALAEPLSSPSPRLWAETLSRALGTRTLAYLVALAVKLRAAGLETELARLSEVAVHVMGGDKHDAFQRVPAKADVGGGPPKTADALGKPAKPRGVGLRR